MEGKVEVFVVASDGSEKCILSEPNLIVNGAGESIVDMLTCPSSILGIDPLPNSIVDASNWRWGALSFGPAASSFRENAYFFPSSLADGSGIAVYWKKDDLCNGVSADISSWLTQVQTDKIMRVLWVSSTIGASKGATASSYTPPYQLPSYPDPTDQKLEDASTSYVIVSGDGTQSFGQFENRIQWASGDPSSYFQGAYPLSGGGNTLADGAVWQTSALLVSSYVGDFQTNPSLNIVASGPQWETQQVSERIGVNSAYNYQRSVDYRGFIETRYGLSSIPWGVVGVSGVQSITTPTIFGDVCFCNDPRLVVETSISPGDGWGLDLYGGIHQMGLWSIDLKKSLETSTVPLFTSVSGGYIDSNGVTPREFRLFAKKTFTENLTQVYDDDRGPYYSGFSMRCDSETPWNFGYELRIRWTIDFRSGGVPAN